MAEELFLTLGCYGRNENGFVLCPGVENRILKISEKLTNYNAIMDYLDVIKLFDKPLINFNAVVNMVYHIQNKFNEKIRPIWTDHEFHLIERFIQMHKSCGLYIQLILTDNTPKKYSNNEDIFVPANKFQIRKT